MPTVNPHPFTRLTPSCVLDAIDAQGFATDGRLMPLNSFENRVFLVGLEDGTSLVAKFYRPGRWSEAALREEHAFVAELVGEDIPVAKALTGPNGGSLFMHEGFRFALFAKMGGRAPELDRTCTLQTLGRNLARLHIVGARRAYRARSSLDVETFGDESRTYLLASELLPPDLRQAYAAVSELVLSGARAAFARAGEIASLRLHGDCHLGNVLWLEDGDGGTPRFLDFDDSRMGPAAQDLWMLLSGGADEMASALKELLAGYELFRHFDRRELHLIEALRSLRLMHYAAWLARRWDDPAFPAAFPWFNTQRYWEEHILQLREQVAAMQEGALVENS